MPILNDLLVKSRHILLQGNVAECRKCDYPCHVRRGDSGPLLASRMFYPGNFFTSDLAKERALSYVKAAMEAAHDVMGMMKCECNGEKIIGNRVNIPQQVP